jgi:uncharacterized RDD family membrane protein YckC
MSNYAFPKATVQHRLGGKAVDLAMYVVTFGVGWVIWSLVVWGQGQTPGKQILKLRVYNKTTNKPVKWGQMAIREALLPMAIVVTIVLLAAVVSLWTIDSTKAAVLGFLYLAGFAIQLIDAFWILKGSERNRLVDKFAKTDVLNEAPND